MATLGGVRQLVGYDRQSLGGWDIATGDRLWTLTPPNDGDFNVPTPVASNGQLLVTTENNGTRLYCFDEQGKIVASPVAANDKLAPDVSSPAVVGRRVFCLSDSLYCLNLDHRLEAIWVGDDDAFCDSSPLFVTDERVLAFGRGSELLLVDAQSADFRIVSRVHPFTDRPSQQAEPLSHPALVGSRLYLRGEKAVICLELDAAKS